MFHHVLFLFSQLPPQVVDIRAQWFQSVDSFFRRFRYNFDKILDTNEPDKQRHYAAAFMFLTTLSNHVGPIHHKVILAEMG